MLETTKQLEELLQDVRTTASPERLQANAQTISMGRDLVEINGEAGAAQLPIPPMFVLDKSGVIRLAFVEEDWSTRVDLDIVVDTLRGLGK